jgi:neutral ceramidase
MSLGLNNEMNKFSMKPRFKTAKSTLIITGLAVWIWALNSGFAAIPPMLQIGAASKIINNEVGNWVQGAGVPKRATKIRDDLEANALYLSNGDTEILLVSCDLAGLESFYAVRAREAMASASGIPARSILLSCTHTHGGPSVLKTNYLMPLDFEYLDRLEGWLVELAQEAVKSARPGKIGWGKGTAQIGFNRRVCWADGTHSMHGDTTRKDFAGLEGPDDPQHLALFAADENDQLISILYHNTTHPTVFYAAGIYSSDFIGEARDILRGEFGQIPVLYMNGAQGDIAIQNQLKPGDESREEKLVRIGRLVVDETLRLYRDVKYHERPVLAHIYEDLQVEVRLPTPEILADARQVLAQIDAGKNIRGMTMIMAFGAVHLQDSYGDNPIDILPIHVVRIGDVALTTQPCELFCQFGLDIKRRSPAPITAVVGLTDGYGGYCPTIYGILGGGYSGQPISWTRLEPNAGYMIVESSGRMLNSLWRSND